MNSSIDSLIIAYFILLFFYYFHSSKGVFYLVTFVSFSALTFSLYFLQARAVFLGSICAIFYWQLRLRPGKGHFTIICLLIIFLSIALAAIKSSSTFSRLFIWKISFKVWLDNWLSGIYPRLFNPVYNHYQAEYFKYDGILSKDAFLANDGYYAFNEWLEILIRFGMAGVFFIFICSLIICLFFHYAKYQYGNIELQLYTGLLIPILVLSFVSYPFHRPYILCFSLLCMVGCFYSFTGIKSIIYSNFNRIQSNFTYFIIILFFGVQELKNSFFNKKWELAKQNWDLNKTAEDFEKMENLYKEFKFSSGVAEYMAIQYWYLDKVSNGITVLEERHNVECNQRFHALLGKWYEASGDSLLAQSHLEMSLYITPHLLQSRMDLALFFQKRNNPEKAKYWANEIIKYPIKVNNPLAHRLKEDAIKIFYSY